MITLLRGLILPSVLSRKLFEIHRSGICEGAEHLTKSQIQTLKEGCLSLWHPSCKKFLWGSLTTRSQMRSLRWPENDQVRELQWLPRQEATVEVSGDQTHEQYVMELQWLPHHAEERGSIPFPLERCSPMQKFTQKDAKHSPVYSHTLVPQMIYGQGTYVCQQWHWLGTSGFHYRLQERRDPVLMLKSDLSLRLHSGENAGRKNDGWKPPSTAWLLSSIVVQLTLYAE